MNIRRLEGDVGGVGLFSILLSSSYMILVWECIADDYDMANVFTRVFYYIGLSRTFFIISCS